MSEASTTTFSNKDVLRDKRRKKRLFSEVDIFTRGTDLKKPNAVVIIIEKWKKGWPREASFPTGLQVDEFWLRRSWSTWDSNLVSQCNKQFYVRQRWRWGTNNHSSLVSVPTGCSEQRCQQHGPLHSNAVVAPRLEQWATNDV